MERWDDARRQYRDPREREEERGRWEEGRGRWEGRDEGRFRGRYEAPWREERGPWDQPDYGSSTDWAGGYGDERYGQTRYEERHAQGRYPGEGRYAGVGRYEGYPGDVRFTGEERYGQGRYGQGRYAAEGRYAGYGERFAGSDYPQREGYRLSQFSRPGYGERGGMGYGRYGQTPYREREEGLGHQLQEFGGAMAGRVRRLFRGPKGYRRSDDRIREDVCDRLGEAPDIDPVEIEVTVSNGEVSLAGFVPERSMKWIAEQIVDEVRGVSDINNQLRVKRPYESTSTGQTTQQGATSTSGVQRPGSQARS